MSRRIRTPGFRTGRRTTTRSRHEAVDEGPPSAEKSATPSATATVPGVATGLVATAGPAQVGLSWTAPSSDGGSPITGYEICAVDKPGTETLVTTTVGAATSYTDTGRINGTTYFYKVAAVNAVAIGSPSNRGSATPIAVAGAPTGLTATRGNAQVGLSLDCTGEQRRLGRSRRTRSTGHHEPATRRSCVTDAGTARRTRNARSPTGRRTSTRSPP